MTQRDARRAPRGDTGTQVAPGYRFYDDRIGTPLPLRCPPAPPRLPALSRLALGCSFLEISRLPSFLPGNHSSPAKMQMFLVLGTPRMYICSAVTEVSASFYRFSVDFKLSLSLSGKAAAPTTCHR